MDKFSNVQLEEAKKFGIFFIDLIENHRDSIICYLAETAVLDWFGHTVKGPRNISRFLRGNVGSFRNSFSIARPVHNIGFRDTHVIKFPR